jgi:hypothetical protein
MQQTVNLDSKCRWMGGVETLRSLPPLACDYMSVTAQTTTYYK